MRFGTDKLGEDYIYVAFKDENNRILKFFVSIYYSFPFLDVADCETIQKFSLILL